jgi:hypothetical protein
MKRKYGYVMFVFLLLILLVGCNLPSAESTQVEPQTAQTLAAQTIEARLTENAGGGQPTGGDSQATMPPTDTPAPTNTMPPTATLPPTNTPLPSATATEAVPCNRAGFVKDVTVPDGEVFAPSTTFTKTWRLKNTGTCTWNSTYDLVFDSGDKMSGGDVVNLTIGNVAANETVDISVDLKSPAASGEYKGYWLLRSGDNEVFGLGNTDLPFYVQIKVADQAGFEILSTSTYECGVDDYVAFRVKNTGTKNLQSSGGSVKNLSTDAVTNYLFWNTPFTENSNDCPPMNISDMEPNDIYYLTANMGSGSGGIKFKFTLTLCTQDNGGGECATQTSTVQIP